MILILEDKIQKLKMTAPSTSPQDFIDFVLKLSSEASGLERTAAVEAITNQLRGFEQNQFFPDVFEELCPDNFSSTTKPLPQYQKDVLTEAIRIYSETCNQ